MAMAAAMARHEHDVEPVQDAEQEFVRRLAERRGDAPPRRVLQAGNLVKAAAAHDTQHRHSPLLVGVGVSSPFGKGETSWTATATCGSSSFARSPARAAVAPMTTSRATRSARPGPISG